MLALVAVFIALWFGIVVVAHILAEIGDGWRTLVRAFKGQESDAGQIPGRRVTRSA